MSAEPVPDYVIESIKPEPDETVVLTVPRFHGPDWTEAVGEQLKRAFPDNRILVLEQGTTLEAEDDPIVATITRQEAESVLRPHDHSLEDAAVQLDRKLIDALDAIDRAEQSKGDR